MVARQRTLAPVATLYVSLAAIVLTVAYVAGARFGSPLELALWYGVAFVAHVWSYRFNDKVHWSYGSGVLAAPLVLSEPGTAVMIGAVLSVMGAVSDVEMSNLKPFRAATNAGQLALVGAATGLTFEMLRPAATEPSTSLLLAVGAAFGVHMAVNAAAVWPAVAYAYGQAEARGILAACWLLGLRDVLGAVAIGAVASTLLTVGSVWTLFATVQIGALAAIPIVRNRLETRRHDIMKAVTSALNARGVVGSAHDHLEDTALLLGHRLGLSSDEIEQLRYVALLYAMTDHFASSLPRSFEDQLRGVKEDEFSSALLLGLPLNDVADAKVLRIADAAAEYEALVRPFEGEPPMAANEAAAELLRSGTSPQIIAALLDETPLSEAYLRAWEIDPTSPWRRPMRWLAERSYAGQHP